MTEFFLRSRWSRVDMFTLGIVLTFLASSSVLPKIGKWEGDHWPVSGQFIIERIERESIGSTLIWGTLTRYRQECDFVRVEWELDGNGTTVPVEVNHLAGSRARPEGVSEFGPLRLSIPPDFLPNTHAVVFHSCPWRPWDTETHLFPPIEEMPDDEPLDRNAARAPAYRR